MYLASWKKAIVVAVVLTAVPLFAAGCGNSAGTLPDQFHQIGTVGGGDNGSPVHKQPIQHGPVGGPGGAGGGPNP
jgi:hypothetical protein